MAEYFIVRWKKPNEDRWYKSTFGEEPTREQAEHQLVRDVHYFFDDIEIELVRVETTVIKAVKGGSGPRRKCD